LEELTEELRERFAIVIITLKLQQSACVAQRVAHFHLGELVGAGDTGTVFARPAAARSEAFITGKFSHPCRDLQRSTRGSATAAMTQANGKAAPMRLSIVHAAVEGRVRFHLGSEGGRRMQLAALERCLRGLKGVLEVRASELTGSLLVRFQAPATTRSLGRAIERAIHGDRRAGPRRQLPQTAPVRARSLSAAAAPARAPAPAPALAPGPGNWHTQSSATIFDHFGVCREKGLSTAEADARLRHYGLNALPRAEPRSAAAIFFDQMRSLPVALLGASAAVSLLTGGIADAIIIGGVVLLNSGIATATERQAERTILGLARTPYRPVAVLRDGREIVLAPERLAPGDVVPIAAGELIPADARLLESIDLTLNEGALTGESLPVHKDADAVLALDAPLAEHANMVYRGTAVTGGRGLAVVTATGEATEIGKIQKMLGTVRPPETPIQRQLGEVGRELVFINGAICAAIFGIGMLRGYRVLPMLRSAISLAVAAVPEGLPAIATTTLALGIQDMRRRNVLVRQLDAVETLGAVQVVCLDKTGTLTANRMTVVQIYAGAALWEVKDGTLRPVKDEAPGIARNVVGQLLETAVLCSEAKVLSDSGRVAIEGTPTETALVRTALDFGIDVVALRARCPLERVVPRGDGRKRMTTLHRSREGPLLAMKGDPAEVLARCRHVLDGGGCRKDLDARTRDEIVRANERMAGRALRVLGIACANTQDVDREAGLTWLGLAGMADPLRPGVASAIARFHKAGIRPVMVTGDQSPTAYAIARELNLGNGKEIRILEAGQLRDMAPAVLAAVAPKAQVFSRVSPANKLQIVQALQADGHVVAMTGDGINDGPALKAAQVGIAMGDGGTDVAREVADIVLASNDLDGVIEAIRLGRATYANIRKVLRFLVGTNASETLVMLGASIAGLVEPLTPMQLLWLNLVSDALPGLALGLEPPEPDILEEPPHDPRAPILSVRDFRRILFEGGVMGGTALATFVALGTNPQARTVAFHGLTMAQLAHTFACRSETHGLIEESRRPPNMKLVAALGACTALQAAAQALPPLRGLLGLTALTPASVGAVATTALAPLVINEILGWLQRPPSGRGAKA
jgi:Ca2+-transporting ATPase